MKLYGRYWLLVVTTSLLFQLAHAAKVPREIHVVTSQWANQTNADGSGYFYELLDKIYAPKGIAIKVKVMPFSHASDALKNGQADVLLGAYANSFDPDWYSNQPVEVDIVDALLTPELYKNCETIHCLEGRRVVAASGYDFDQYLDIKMDYIEVRSVDSMVKMLMAGRVDAVLDYKQGIREVMRQLDKTRPVLLKESILEFPGYFVFYGSERGRAFKKIFDQSMEQLIANGEIKALQIKNFGHLNRYPLQ